MCWQSLITLQSRPPLPLRKWVRRRSRTSSLLQSLSIPGVLPLPFFRQKERKVAACSKDNKLEAPKRHVLRCVDRGWYEPVLDIFFSPVGRKREQEGLLFNSVVYFGFVSTCCSLLYSFRWCFLQLQGQLNNQLCNHSCTDTVPPSHSFHFDLKIWNDFSNSSQLILVQSS